MQRPAVSMVVVPVLLAATAAAFVVTEELKLSKPLLTLFDVRDTSGRHISHLTFSPTCDCPSRTAHIGVRLRDPQRVAVNVIDDSGAIVRRLDPARRAKALGLRWDGRTDAGKVAPDGTYRFRLDLPHRTVVMPNPITLDTTAPKVHVTVTDRTFSPDGDGRRDRVAVGYTSNEQLFDVQLVVTGPGARHVVRAGRRRAGFRLTWPTRGGASRRIPEGRYRLTLQGRDLAGNRVTVPAGDATVRYVAIVDPKRSLTGGQKVGVDADTPSVRATLLAQAVGAATGPPVRRASLRGGVYTLPDGLPGGIYRLTVRTPSGHSATLLLAVRGSPHADVGLVLPSSAALTGAQLGPGRVDGLTGADLKNPELLSGYKRLLVPSGSSLAPKVASAYRATGGSIQVVGGGG